MIAGFRAGTLPKGEWTHRAHLTGGLWFLEQFGLERARAMMPDAIRRFNVASGGENTATSGYHETITQFYLTIIDGFRRHYRGSGGFADRANALFDALGARDVPLRHYSAELLWSVEARARWIEPDLLPIAD